MSIRRSFTDTIHQHVWSCLFCDKNHLLDDRLIITVAAQNFYLIFCKQQKLRHVQSTIHDGEGGVGGYYCVLKTR